MTSESSVCGNCSYLFRDDLGLIVVIMQSYLPKSDGIERIWLVGTNDLAFSLNVVNAIRGPHLSKIR